VKNDMERKQAVFVDLLNDMDLIIKKVNFMNIRYIYLIFYYYYTYIYFYYMLYINNFNYANNKLYLVRF